MAWPAQGASKGASLLVMLCPTRPSAHCVLPAAIPAQRCPGWWQMAVVLSGRSKGLCQGLGTWPGEMPLKSKRNVAPRLLNASCAVDGAAVVGFLFFMF